MADTWSDAAIRRITDTTACPRCGARLVRQGECARCGADLSGARGVAVWEATLAAVEAIRRRQDLVDALGVAATAPSAPAPTGAGVAATPAAASMAP